MLAVGQLLDVLFVTSGSSSVYLLGGLLAEDWIRLEGGVKIVLVIAYLTWDIWGVLATHNPSSHLFMVGPTVPFWLKYEQIDELVIC